MGLEQMSDQNLSKSDVYSQVYIVFELGKSSA